jgi:O-antigen/teichoic acid export membrane protein
MKKQTIFNNTLWLSAEKLLSMLLSLGVMLIMARHLAPGLFGQLSYLISLIAILTPFGALGLNALITRELVRYPENTASIIGTALGLRIIGCIISFFIGYVLTHFIVEGDLIVFWYVLLLGNIFSSFLVFDYWLQAKEVNRYASLIRLVVLIVMSLLRVLSVYFNASLDMFIYLYALEMAFVGLLFLSFYLKKGKLIFSLTKAINLLRQSGWLILSGVAAVIYLKVDQVMLGMLSNDSEVGIYAVAARLSEVWYFFPVAIVISNFPKLLEVKKNNEYLYSIKLQKLNDLLFSLSILLALVVSLFSDWIVPLLFGEAFSGSSLVLKIHIWAGVFIFMRALLSKWLLIEGLLKFSLITQVCGAIINVGLNYVLIPIHGAVGAAIATIASYAVASFFSLLLHRDTWPMALVVAKSFLLPFRLAYMGRSIYG